MDTVTINHLGDSLSRFGQFVIGACALTAALLSLGFLLAIIGSALWQTASDAQQVMRRKAHFPSRLSHSARRALGIFIPGGAVAAATFAESSRVVAVCSYFERGNAWMA